jgi:hypothetical protein
MAAPTKRPLPPPVRVSASKGGGSAFPPRPEQNPDPLPPIEEPEAEEEAPRVVTVGEEQLARSLEMQAMGIEAWKAAHDERNPDQTEQSVAGVGWSDDRH